MTLCELQSFINDINVDGDTEITIKSRYHEQSIESICMEQIDGERFITIGVES